jgi:hypothetical protein
VDVPRLHEALTASWWARQAKALASAKPPAVHECLAALERAHGQLDFERFDAARLSKPDEVAERIEQLTREFARALKAATERARNLETAAGRWQTQFKADPKAKEGLGAVARMLREATGYRSRLEGFTDPARQRLKDRLEALKAQQAPRKNEKKPDTPERRRVRTRMLDQLRIVKQRPDRKVYFLLCVGHASSVAYLHSSPVSDAQKPLLTKVMQGDRGLKWYRGECRWEEGAVTFVGSNLSSTLGRRIQSGANELAGGSVGYRIRAHA